VGRLSSLVRGNLWQPRRHGGATAGEFGGAGAFGNLEKVGPFGSWDGFICFMIGLLIFVWVWIILNG